MSSLEDMRARAERGWWCPRGSEHEEALLLTWFRQVVGYTTRSAPSLRSASDIASFNDIAPTRTNPRRRQPARAPGSK